MRGWTWKDSCRCNSLLRNEWAHGMFVTVGSASADRARPHEAGVGVAEAQTAMNVLTRRMQEAYPASDKGIGARVVPETLARPLPLRSLIEIVPFIRFCMLFLAALVLTLACMNVANILLVRSTVREREMAIRAALGSGRGRLIRQMLTESVLLSLLGAAAGMVLGNWVSQRFADSLPGFVPDLPVLIDVSFDWRVFSYALTAALLAGCLIGIFPALQGFARRCRRRAARRKPDQFERSAAPAHPRSSRRGPGGGIAGIVGFRRTVRSQSARRPTLGPGFCAGSHPQRAHESGVDRIRYAAHQGFLRRARTPREGLAGSAIRHPGL